MEEAHKPPCRGGRHNGEEEGTRATTIATRWGGRMSYEEKIGRSSGRSIAGGMQTVAARSGESSGGTRLRTPCSVHGQGFVWTRKWGSYGRREWWSADVLRQLGWCS
ncbi:hypothetical protein ACJRO7_000241 [Eucalyptus globulus]|uniref:Uncharacterized protein n=1 Tax=Eucalyptus globulus TaxID=34317 RepID=A0ABD3LSB1_EUCGL